MQGRDRFSVLPAPPRPHGRRTHSYPPPEVQPVRCIHTATRPDGERIFAIEGGNLSTGGMTETELRALIAQLEELSLDPSLRRTIETIKAALSYDQG